LLTQVAKSIKILKN